MSNRELLPNALLTILEGTARRLKGEAWLWGRLKRTARRGWISWKDNKVVAFGIAFRR